MARALVVALLGLVLPGAAAAGTEDLAPCLAANATMQGYADQFIMRGWRPVAETDDDFDRVMRSSAEIIGTLHTFPAAFTEPGEVRVHVDRIVSFGRQMATVSQVALFSRGDLALMVMFDTSEDEARLRCYLSGKTLPDVADRLPESGRNPSGEPLAWNVMSSGPLDTAHVFGEILYVRLFFQPAQHLLAGGDGVVTHLRFRREATSI